MFQFNPFLFHKDYLTREIIVYKRRKIGNLAKAARLYGAAETLLHLSGYTLWNETRRMNDWVHEFSISQNHELIETEKHAGGLFTLEEAIEFALSDDQITSPVS